MIENLLQANIDAMTRLLDAINGLREDLRGQSLQREPARVEAGPGPALRVQAAPAPEPAGITLDDLRKACLKAYEVGQGNAIVDFLAAHDAPNNLSGLAPAHYGALYEIAKKLSND